MKSVDILFIHPNASHKVYQDLSKDFSAIEPPIWAGMLTSHCLRRGFRAEILDCEAPECRVPLAEQRPVRLDR